MKVASRVPQHPGVGPEWLQEGLSIIDTLPTCRRLLGLAGVPYE
jgi:hypothetical protein